MSSYLEKLTKEIALNYYDIEFNRLLNILTENKRDDSSIFSDPPTLAIDCYILNEISENALRKLFVLIGPKLQSLTIELFSDIVNPIKNPIKISLYLIYDFISMCPRLENLNFTKEYIQINNAILLPAPDLQNLRTFTLNGCGLTEKVVGKWLSECSDNLKTLTLNKTFTRGESLWKAPRSLRSLSFNTQNKYNFEYLREYTKLNPNLQSLDMFFPSDTKVDLGQICDNLRQLQKLRLMGARNITQFEYLAQLKRLSKLTIKVATPLFCEYPKSLTNENCLTELGIRLSLDDVTPELAESFEKLKTLNKITLEIRPRVRNEDRIWPYLGKLPHLKHVSIFGKPVNMKSVCSSLAQIETLKIDINTSCELPFNLKNQKNLIHIDIEIRGPYSGRTRYDPTTLINFLLRVVAESPSVKSLGLKVLAYIKLFVTTIFELNKCDLRSIDVYNVFNPDQAKIFVENTLGLRKFTQSAINCYPPAKLSELRNVRREQLEIVHYDEYPKNLKDKDLKKLKHVFNKKL